MMQESRLTNFQQRKLKETMMSKILTTAWSEDCLQPKDLWFACSISPVLLVSCTIHLFFYPSCLPDGQSLPAQCLPTSSKPGTGRPTRSSQTARKKKNQKPQSGLRSKESIQQMSDCTPNYRPPPQSTVYIIGGKIIVQTPPSPLMKSGNFTNTSFSIILYTPSLNDRCPDA